MGNMGNAGTSGSDNGFDRRAFMRRAAIVGAATAWATPSVQSVVAPAFAAGSAPGGCTACMTGGGQLVSGTQPGAPVVLFNGARIAGLNFGLGQICCDGLTDKSTLEVVAHRSAKKQDDISWHFVTAQVTCTYTGNAAPPPATSSCPNTFTGTATDNEGNTINFVFTDNGEGAGAIDQVSINISGIQGTLTGSGPVTNGNLQAHPGLGKGPARRDCVGC